MKVEVEITIKYMNNKIIKIDGKEYELVPVEERFTALPNDMLTVTNKDGLSRKYLVLKTLTDYDGCRHEMRIVYYAKDAKDYAKDAKDYTKDAKDYTKDAKDYTKDAN